MFPFLLLPVELQQLILGYKGQYYPKTMDMAKFAFTDAPGQFGSWVKQILIRDDVDGMDILQNIGYHHLRRNVVDVFNSCAMYDSIECYKVLSKKFYFKEFSTDYFKTCLENNSIQIWSFIIPFFNKSELQRAIELCIDTQNLPFLQIFVDKCDKIIFDSMYLVKFYQNLPTFEILYPHIKILIHDLIQAADMKCIVFVLEQQPHLIREILLCLFAFYLDDRIISSYKLIDDLLPYLRPEDVNDSIYFTKVALSCKNGSISSLSHLIDRLVQCGCPMPSTIISSCISGDANPKIIDKLLSLGANRQCPLALNTAIEKKSIELIKYLVEAGFSFSNDAILVAIKTLNTGIVRLVLQLGAPKNPKALIMVCNITKNMQLPILTLLLQFGYDMPSFISDLQPSDTNTGMQNYLKCSRLWSKF